MRFPCAATGHADGRIALWDIDNGARLASLKRSDAAITSIAFTRDGWKLLAAGQDAVLAIWVPSTLKTGT